MRVEGLMPVYDMLPMMNMPQRGEIIVRKFQLKPILHLPLNVFSQALEMAVAFWEDATRHHYISNAFKAASRGHLTVLKNRIDV